MAPPLSTFGHRDEGLNGAMHALLDMQLTEISTKFKGQPQGLSLIIARQAMQSGRLMPASQRSPSLTVLPSPPATQAPSWLLV
jgi:hypothetical protein